MTTLLVKLFIKNSDDVTSPAVRRAYGTLVSTVGIILNLLLAAGKFTVGFIFGAISIQADAMNNFSDAGTQIISLISFKLAAKPADREHPFGHARIEYVASMIVSFLVLLVGWELISESFHKIISPATQTTFSWIAVVVLAVSVVVKLWLFLFNRKIAKKINSSVMRATSADSLSDAAATSAVLAATLIFKFTSLDIDAYVGMVVAILIIVAGIKILNETKNAILGEGPSDEIVADIQALATRYPEVLGIHDLVVHNYGPGRIMASFHAEVDGCVDMFLSHAVIDRMERELQESYHIQASIHMDPIITNDPLVEELRAVAAAHTQAVHPSLLIHDFRIVPGDSHTNMIFDIAVPFEIKMTDEEIRQTVADRIHTENPQRFAVITIDRT